MKNYFRIISTLILFNFIFSQQMVVVGEVFTETW